MAKVFLNDSNLERLMAALESPVQSQIKAPQAKPVRGKKAAPVGLSLGSWKEGTPFTGKNVASEKKTGKSNSVFSRVIDVLSRGNYASAEAFKRATDPNDNDDGWNFTEAVKGFGSGAAGKDKTRFSEVLKQNGHKGRGAGTLGVALDIFADPTTYLGVGLAGKAVGTAGKGAKASKAAEAMTPDVVRLGVNAGKAVGRKATTGSFRKGGAVPTGKIKPRPTDVASGAVGSSVIYRVLQDAKVVESPEEAAAFTARLLALDVTKGGKGVPSKYKHRPNVEDLIKDLVTAKPKTESEIFVDTMNKAAAKQATAKTVGVDKGDYTVYEGYLKSDSPNLPEAKATSKANTKKLQDTLISKNQVQRDPVTIIRPKSGEMYSGQNSMGSKMGGTPYLDDGNHRIAALREVGRSVKVRFLDYDKKGFSDLSPVDNTVKNIESVAAPVVKTTKPTKSSVEIADAKYDKEMGIPGEQTTSELRALAATGDAAAIKNLKAVEIDPSYKSYLAKASKAPKTPAPVARTVPEILESTPAPKEAPTSTVTRLTDADEVLSNSQRVAAEAGVAKTLDTMSTKGITSFGPTNVKKNTEFTPPNQVNAFNSAYTDVLREQGKRPTTPRRVLMADPNFREAVIASYRRIEAGVEATGKRGRVSMKDATPIRLSSFLDRLSPEDWDKSGFGLLTQLMNGKTGISKYDDMRAVILAGSHAEDAAKIKAPVETIIDAVRAAIGSPTDEAVADLFKGGNAVAKTLAKDADLSPVGAAMLTQVTKEAVIAAKAMPTEDGVHLVGQLAGATATITRLTELGDVKEAANALARLNKNNDRYLGIYLGGQPALRLLNLSRINAGPKSLTALKPMYDALDKTEEWLGIAFRTSFGKDAEGNILFYSQDIKNVDRRAINNANQRAQSAIEGIRDVFAGTPNKDARFKVFRDAQLDDASPLAMRMEAAKSLARRNAIDDETINEFYVKSYPKPAKTADPKDIKRPPFLIDPKKGFDGWKDPALKVDQDIAHDLFKFETAIDKAIVERQVYSHLAGMFGQAKGADGLVPAKNLDPMLDGLYFTPTDLKDIQNYKAIVKDFGDPSSPIMQNFDKVQGIWKTMATRANPQYYVRNGVGEVFINWLNGVNSVAPYNMARKITKWRNPEVAVDGLEGVTNGTVILKNAAWGDVTTDMAWTAFNTSGARQTFAVTDNLTDTALNKAPGKTMGFINNIADTEEGFLRMAHFMDILSKSKAKTLQEAANEAAITVNRAHGDYADLTKFERKVMKRIIPFYTWQRKVTPILLESAARNPGKIMVYPKIQIAIAQNYGLELDDSNPFPQPDFLLPSYLADGAAVPYYTRANGNPVLGDPGNPFNDQLRDLSKPESFIESALGPAIKAPLELYGRKTDRNPNGTRFFGDAPIPDKTDYLADQIPLLSTFNRLTRNQAGPGTDKSFGEDEKGTNVIALLNWLTASRLTEVTDRVEKSGEFDAKAKAVKANKKAEAEAKK